MVCILCFLLTLALSNLRPMMQFYFKDVLAVMVSEFPALALHPAKTLPALKSNALFPILILLFLLIALLHA
jgi:hypothetical protein